MKRTAGDWDSTDKNLYFAANVPSLMSETAKTTDHLLVAINEINATYEQKVDAWIAQGKKVFIDSGVFNLASEHARAHGVSHNVGLGMAPDDIDGFDALLEKYCSVLGRIGDRCWGYIEIDQGGRDNKIKTRNRLEALGLNPIPVYHPLIDGWDYFDELASEYDRICVGNLVQASVPVRRRIIRTIWQRRQAYPGLWIHLLGVSPNQLFVAYPMDSCDSSSLSALTRWPVSASITINTPIGLEPGPPLSEDYVYKLGADKFAPDGYAKAHRVGAYNASMLRRNWKSIAGEYERGGLV